MCEGAAYGGHLKVLKWARAKGCDWDNDKMCMIAAEGGQLEILK